MIDKVKVLHGLSSCGTDHGIPNICEVTECPYREDKAWCVHGLAHDAGVLIAELLKAQEPRVMTLEEYEAWIDTPFTERNPVFHEERTKRGTVTCWVNTVVCTLREYGKNDRCWTSRPTDEQREKEPWNG